ncbi:PPE family protein [Mycobacterium europaeum]|uniref:PPE family protein n=1 Tax=Mycobacterium europaeum TaxID=761804 RepID=A0A0U1DJM5_9MYCO|nr:PPE family protein [Mycobacterium europaeum]CQD17826.1 PPE family protein [Mycobacterium europaeum]
MDFGALPPEVNSARMYAGAGAGPMMAAAAAWNTLSAELSTIAAGYESVISELTGEQWMGPAAASAETAVQPFVTWLNTTAAAAQHAGAQAMASAAAYEAAFAMTVPPPVIEANRAQLAALVASNVLGQNTPAIMATEAQYSAMWAQDAAAMYGYAASSAAAGKLNPLTSPTPTTSPGGIARQAAVVSGAGAATNTQAGLMQTVNTFQNTVAGFAAPSLGADPPAATPLFQIPIVQNTINGAINTAAWWTMNTIPNATLLSHTMNGAPSVMLETAGPYVGPMLAGSVAPGGSAGIAQAPVLAGVGQASTVGRLSVPAGWSATIPALDPAASASAGSGWAVTPEETAPVTAVPAGMPALATAGRGLGFNTPRYGVKPTVMPKTVFA